MTSILEAKKTIEEVLLQREEVIGVGISPDGQRIRIYVLEENETVPDIPKMMAGFDIEIFPIPGISPMSGDLDPDFRERRFRPVLGGISAAHTSVTAGTLGAVIRDKMTGNKLFLSNNHVFANTSTPTNFRAHIGDPIIQPSCFSEDTRVLTESGFKYFYDLDNSDRICTLNPNTYEIEYHIPSEMHSYAYTGDMIYFSGQMYDQLVTPNHKLVVIRNATSENTVEFITAGEIVRGVRDIYYTVMDLSEKFGNKHMLISELTGVSRNTIKQWINTSKRPTISNESLQFIKNGIWIGNNVDYFEIPRVLAVTGRTKQITKFKMTDWLEFLGWYLSEGSLGGEYKSSAGDYVISIRQRDYESLNEIANIVRMMGFAPNIRYEHGSVTFNSKELHSYLKQFGHAKEKFIPLELKQLSPKYLRILLTSLFSGDGSLVGARCDGYRDNYLGCPGQYFTISKRLADDVAEIALKCGYGISIQRRECYATELMTSRGTPVGTRYNDGYIIGLSCRNLTPRITKKPTVIQYSGFVYDVTVQNHILLVERNGKIVWSGNSADGGASEDTVATLYKFVPFSDDKTNLVDAALAMPIDQSIASPYILADGRFNTISINGIRSISSPIRVKKYGRTSGADWGEILDWNFTVAVDFDDGKTRNFVDQILVAIETRGGDSGALLLDSDNHAVGLVFAGGIDKKGNWYGVANKIMNVLAILSDDDVDISEGWSRSQAMYEAPPQFEAVGEGLNNDKV